MLKNFLTLKLKHGQPKHIATRSIRECQEHSQSWPQSPPNKPLSDRFLALSWLCQNTISHLNRRMMDGRLMHISPSLQLKASASAGHSSLVKQQLRDQGGLDGNRIQCFL